MLQYIYIFGKPISTMIILYALGGLFCFVNFVLKRERYGYSKGRAICYALFFISIGMIELKAMGIIRSGVLSFVSSGEYVPDTSVRIFGVVFFQPIAAYLVSLFSGDKFRKVLDSFTVETFLYFAFGKLSCHLKGCCYGFPFENGVTSIVYGGKVFPVQLCETISALIVVAILVYLSKGKVKLRTGSLFPIGAILYSIGRFGWEYCRFYKVEWEKNILLGMNFWQICCVIAIMVSIVWLIILYKTPKYEYCDFGVNPKSIGGKLEIKYIAWKKRKQKEKQKVRRVNKSGKKATHRKKRK